MTDLDRLDALAAAATPGPWHDEGGYIKAGAAALTTVADVRYKHGTEDRAFIVALVNAWPTIRELVAAVRERDELREAAEAAFTDFVYAQGSDFDRTEFPGMARLELHLDDGAALHREAGT